MTVVQKIISYIFGPDTAYCDHLTEDGRPWTANEGVCPECCNGNLGTFDELDAELEDWDDV